MINTKNTKSIYFIEVTDTYGGEANYCWAHRYLVKASSLRGAVSVVSKHEGFAGRIRLDGNYGDMTRHNVTGAAICIFTQYADEYNSEGVQALNFEQSEEAIEC